MIKALLAALFLASPAGALEYAPIFRATLMGGQYFKGNERSSLNGNANVVAGAAMKASESWTVVPTFNSVYQGTKGVNEGTAAGTLYQQSMSHRLGVAGVRQLEGTWRFRPSVGYSREFLKETRDEAWGKGLFDYEKISAGVEFENVYRDPFSFRMGLDVFKVRFPNYISLESKAGVDPQGNPLGRELAGTNVLDTHNVQASMSGSWPYPAEDPKVSMQASYSVLYQRYFAERLINAQGLYTDHAPETRQDFLQTGAFTVAHPRNVSLFGSNYRLDSAMGTSFSYNGSNQNTFDAAQAKYISDAYSYMSYGLGPSFTLAWGNSKQPTAVSFGLRYQRTQYLGRLARTATGIYTNDHQHQSRYQASLSYAYPIAPAFMLKAQANMLWARSNNLYEQGYAYNYRTSNFLMGFSYEY